MKNEELKFEYGIKTSIQFCSQKDTSHRCIEIFDALTIERIFGSGGIFVDREFSIGENKMRITSISAEYYDDRQVRNNYLGDKYESNGILRIICKADNYKIFDDPEYFAEAVKNT